MSQSHTDRDKAHEATSSQGTMKFLDDDNNVTFICEWRRIRDMELAAKN
jgi:hypothetical protein